MLFVWHKPEVLHNAGRCFLGPRGSSFGQPACREWLWRCLWEQLRGLLPSLLPTHKQGAPPP